MTRRLAVAGWILAALGALVLAFVAFELWGTGLLADHAQARLRAELRRELPTTRLHVPVVALRPPAGPKTAPAEPAPADGQPVGSLSIPSIGLQMVVVEGVAASDLALGPGHYPGTPLPGEAGNVAIAGHRTTYLHPFGRLTAVRPGTAIVLTTPQGVFVYSAGSEQVVDPGDVAVLGPDGANTLTLTTCNPPYSAATRLVLRATLIASTLPSPPAARVVRHRTGRHARRAQHAGRARIAGQGGSFWAAIGWGAATAGLCVGTLALVRRVRRRWPVAALGAIGVATALFWFFCALQPFLPSTI